jgi:hypothetical protein
MNAEGGRQNKETILPNFIRSQFVSAFCILPSAF